MTADPAELERAPLDDSVAYREAYERLRPGPLRDRLHSLAHDRRIPAGLARAWALTLMAWRAAARDRRGWTLEYPTPPSSSLGLDVVQAVDRVAGELVCPFRSREWRNLAATRPPAEAEAA